VTYGSKEQSDFAAVVRILAYIRQNRADRKRGFL